MNDGLCGFCCVIWRHPILNETSTSIRAHQNHNHQWLFEYYVYKYLMTIRMKILKVRGMFLQCTYKNAFYFGYIIFLCFILYTNRSFSQQTNAFSNYLIIQTHWFWMLRIHGFVLRDHFTLCSSKRINPSTQPKCIWVSDNHLKVLSPYRHTAATCTRINDGSRLKVECCRLCYKGLRWLTGALIPIFLTYPFS